MGIVFCLGWLWTHPACSQSFRREPTFSSASRRFPLRITADRAEDLNWVLRQTESCYAHVLPLISSAGTISSHQIHLFWKNRTSYGFETFPRTIEVGDTNLDVRIHGGGTPRTASAQEALFRSLTLALLQLVMVREKPIQIGEVLANPPVWLVEGFAMLAQPDQHESLQRVIYRMKNRQLTPSLEDMQNRWKEPSPDILERRFQQAFAFRLVQSLLATEMDRRALFQWLMGPFRTQSDPFWENPATVEGWWKEQVAATTIQHRIPLLSWDETAASLRELLHFPLRFRGERNHRVVSLAALPEHPRMVEPDSLPIDLTRRLQRLAAQSHFAWSDLIIRYERALGFWLAGKFTAYQTELTFAAAEQQRLGEYRKASHDLLNWVLVNFRQPEKPGENDWIDLTLIEMERVRSEAWRRVLQAKENNQISDQQPSP